MGNESPLLQAVRATVAAGSARLACFSRKVEPVPEDVDVTAEGIADLSTYRALFRRRRGFFTERQRAELRSANRLARVLVGKRKRRRAFKTRYVAGPQDATLSRKGVWSALYPPRNPDGSLYAPEEIADPELNEVLDNPLWPLKPIAKVTGGVEEIATDEIVRGVPTRRLSTALTAEHMTEHPWRWLAERRGPPGRKARRSYEPQPIEALVWVDADNLIRRISYVRGVGYRPDQPEPVFDAPVWEILELWDFGIDVADAFPF